MSRIRTLVASAVFLFILSTSLAFASLQFDPNTMMRSSELKVGMTGVCKTVFQGAQIEEMPFVIEGILENEWYGGDIILFRITGGPLVQKKLGILSGMSGSPLYINGKLIGAVSLGFTLAPKVPAGGATPIEQMLESSPVPAQENVLLPAVKLSKPVTIEGKEYKMAQIVTNKTVVAQPAEDVLALSPAATPLIVSGLRPERLDLLNKLFEPYNLRAVPGGGPPSNLPDIPMEPGSALGIPLVSGDISITAIGTLTYRQGDEILGFGHPMMKLGDVDLPMSTAWIHRIEEDYLGPFKMGSSVKIVGSITRDHTWAIGGRVGQMPALIPFEVKISYPGKGRDRDFKTQVVKHPMLTLWMLDEVGYEAMLSAVDDTPEMSATVTTYIKPEGLKPIELKDFYTERWYGVYWQVTNGLWEVLYRLRENEYKSVNIEEAKVSVEITEDYRSAYIERVDLDKRTYHPGDEVNLKVVIKRFQDEQRVIEPVSFKIPENTPDGTLEVMIDGGVYYGYYGYYDGYYGFSTLSAPSSNRYPRRLMPSSNPPGTIAESFRSDDSSLPPYYYDLQSYVDYYLSDRYPENELITQVYYESGGVSFRKQQLHWVPPLLSNLIRQYPELEFIPGSEGIKQASSTPWSLFGSEHLAIVVSRERWEGGRGPAEGGAYAQPGGEYPSEYEGDGEEGYEASPPMVGRALTPEEKWQMFLALPWNRYRPLLALQAQLTPQAQSRALAAGPALAGSRLVAATSLLSNPIAFTTPPRANLPRKLPETMEQYKRYGVGDGGDEGYPSVPPEVMEQLKAYKTRAAAATAAEAAGEEEEGEEEIVGKVVTRVRFEGLQDFASFRFDGTYPTKDGRIAAMPSFRKLADLSEPLATAIAADGQGNVYVAAGLPSKLFRFDTSGKLTATIETGEFLIESLAVAKDGTLFCGTAPGGKVLVIKGQAPQTFASLNAEHILSLKFDEAGNLWAATGGEQAALYRISPDGNAEVVFKKDGYRHVIAFAQNRSGKLCLATSVPDALFLFDPQTGETQPVALAPPGSGEEAGGFIAIAAIGDDFLVSASEQMKEKRGYMGRGKDYSQGYEYGYDNDYAYEGGSQRSLLVRLKSDGSLTPVPGPQLVSSTLEIPEGVLLFSAARSGGVWLLSDLDKRVSLRLMRVLDNRVTAACKTPSNDVFFITTRPLSIYALQRSSSNSSSPSSDANPASAIAESPPQEVGQVGQWVSLNLQADEPGSSNVAIYTRSGNSSLPDETWSQWSKVFKSKRGSFIFSPLAEFIQFRVVLEPDSQGDSPSLSYLDFGYLGKNAPPTLEAPELQRTSRLKGKQTITWQATDPDGDKLSFDIFYSGDNGKSWEELAKNVKEQEYEADTAKVPDGAYIVKVVATDARSNPTDPKTVEKISGKVFIDNTPPTFAKYSFKEETDPSGSFRFRGIVKDVGGEVVAVQYRLDDGDWTACVPTDGAFDSEAVRFNLTIEKPKPGTHNIDLMAFDDFGNKVRQRVVVGEGARRPRLVETPVSPETAEGEEGAEAPESPEGAEAVEAPKPAKGKPPAAQPAGTQPAAAVPEEEWE